MEKMNKTCYVFQVDSDIVQQVYAKQNNFLIEYDNKGDKNWCAIYFVVMIFIILIRMKFSASESSKKFL